MLEAHALRGIRTTLGQILVDDVDPCRGSAERHGALDQLILPSRAFTVVDQLARSRLPDVDIGQVRTVRISDLGARVCSYHGCSPARSRPGYSASAGSGRRGSGPAAAACVHPGSSTGSRTPGDSPRGTVRAGAVSWCISSLPVSIAQTSCARGRRVGTAMRAGGGRQGASPRGPSAWRSGAARGAGGGGRQGGGGGGAATAEVPRSVTARGI